MQPPRTHLEPRLKAPLTRGPDTIRGGSFPRSALQDPTRRSLRTPYGQAVSPPVVREAFRGAQMNPQPTHDTDWYEILEAALERSDRVALQRLMRLVNSFLARWNAYDFQDEWDDLIQEVLVAVAVALREGRIRERRATLGYIRSTARFKFVDRLKQQMRWRENERLPWEEMIDEDEAKLVDDSSQLNLQRDLREALNRLPDKQREVVMGVHVQGKTYQQVAEETGIPLGSLKRNLHQGLRRLRESLAGALGDG